jgi:hypothetical protein
MPKISDFQPKKSSKKGEWDLSSFSSPPEATRPQRRPGRGDDAPLQSVPADQEISDPLVQKEVATTLEETVSGGVEPATKWQQTDNKPATTPSKTGNKVVTNRQQSGNTPGAASAVIFETGNKVATEPATLSATKWQQTDNKPATATTFSALVGLQSALIVFLYQSCKAARSRCTDALTLEHMAACLGSHSGSVKTTLQRLEAKGYISRIGFKNGRGGWSKYELPDALFRELLQFETENKLATKWQQTDNKVGTKPATEPATSLSSSSSSLDLENFKTTTTGGTEFDFFNPDKVRLAPEWERIDLTPLESIGFTLSHLIQVARQGKISAQETQDSIHFFEFDLRRNGKAQTLNGPALNFFMGILRKGIPYAPPENYVSPEDEARREYCERMKQIEEKRASEAQEIFDLHFRAWEAKLVPEERDRILPEYAKKRGPMSENCLRSHFTDQVWPELRLQVPGIQSIFEPVHAQKSEGVSPSLAT